MNVFCVLACLSVCVFVRLSVTFRVRKFRCAETPAGRFSMMEPDKGSVLRRRLQTTVFCQCFSPCGKYLAVADKFGYVSVFNLPAALGPDATEEALKPAFAFRVYTGGVFSMLSTETQLIVSGSGNIQCFNWNDIFTKVYKPVWQLEVPPISRFDSSETNSISTVEQSGHSKLFGGCGDNLVHIWDLSTGSLVQSLRGHTDYVHKVLTRNEGRECISASEDGSLRLWDTRRAGEAVHSIEPYKHDRCARPRVGKWLACADMGPAEDWLVCGGGPHLSLWHLRSLTRTSVFDAGKTKHQHVMFYQDSIISAGSEANVFHWSVNSELRSKVPCTPTHAFSVVINENDESSKVLCIAGNCHKVDVCTNFGYKAFSLLVC